jgi:hypothetical protein
MSVTSSGLELATLLRLAYRLNILLYPTSYPMGTGVHSPVVKWPERDNDHSSPTSTEVKKTSDYVSTPLYVFMASCLIS